MSTRLPSEKSLLLTAPDGLLAEKDSRKIIKGLQVPLARIYKVQRTEWMEKIAQESGIPANAIRSTNNLDDPLLRPNQEIILQNKKGMMHIAKADESLEAIIRNYEKLGGKRQEILAQNPLDEITVVKAGELYVKEGSRVWIASARRSFPFLARPCAWTRISSQWGVRRHPILKTRRFHDGYDLVASYGSPVFASQVGEVVFSGWKGGYGNVIEIRHSQITTRYGHLSQVYVHPGQRVRKSQIIGRVGSTGLSTGPHLHFEVRRNSDGKSMRPGKYLF